MLNFIRKTYAWFSLADYEEASEQATQQIVKRYTRGNVSVQNGRYLNEKGLSDLSAQGDKAAARLSRKIS